MQTKLVVDVREDHEWEMGHGKNSINIPLSRFQKELPKLTKHKNEKIVLVCASGGRSSMAMSILQANEFKDVTNGGPWTNYK